MKYIVHHSLLQRRLREKAGAVGKRWTCEYRRESIMNLLKRHPILAFYLLTLLISWPVKIPVSLSLTSNILLRFLPSLMPAVAALVITALIAGKHGISALLRQLSPARTSLWLYLAVIIGPIILSAIALGINLLLGQPAPMWINPGLRLLTFLPGYSLRLRRNSAGAALSCHVCRHAPARSLRPSSWDYSGRCGISPRRFKRFLCICP